MILFPTETLYALGVNALDAVAIKKLEEFKGRGQEKTLSWLVRDKTDIAHFAKINEQADKLIDHFLPGPVTLVLPVKEVVPPELTQNGTVGFRVSSDQIAQKIIANFMKEYKAPLTCTSANVSGEEPASTTNSILQQFTDHNIDTSVIDKVIDDGVRDKTNSTVVKITVDKKLTILREGPISKNTILNSLN